MCLLLRCNIFAIAYTDNKHAAREDVVSCGVVWRGMLDNEAILEMQTRLLLLMEEG